MNYDPKAASSLIADGEYDGEIAVAEESTSKAGNAMIKLTVRVWAGNGGPRTVFDYIVNPSTLWKLKQIAAASGKMDAYNSGAMGADDLVGLSVRVGIKTDKDKTGRFEDKNAIARYLAPEAGAGAGEHGKPVGDDGIPF